MSSPNRHAHPDLRLDSLPPLPQSQVLRAIAPRLWRNDHILALWLGGSLAAGTGDLYSDIDLRVAVAPADLADWETADLQSILDEPALARHLVRLGEGAFIHHLILQSGDILDLLMQSADATPGDEPLLILGCRSDDLSKRLASCNQPPPHARIPVTSDVVRELLVAFWTNCHKHRKVLHRGLDLMFPAASYANWQMLMRMWYIDATGCDTSAYHFSGIHGLTELGRRLAERFSFDYPMELENTVRRDWNAFRTISTMTAPN
jgi:hypothetical protein